MSKVYYESKNLNKVPEDVMEEMLGGTCQCGNQNKDDELLRKMEEDLHRQIRMHEECSKELTNAMNQNECLRKRIGQLKGEIGKLEQEIRNRDSEGDDMIRLIRKLSGTDAAEIQVTVRMKNYFDD